MERIPRVERLPCTEIVHVYRGYRERIPCVEKIPCVQGLPFNLKITAPAASAQVTGCTAKATGDTQSEEGTLPGEDTFCTGDTLRGEDTTMERILCVGRIPRVERVSARTGSRAR